MEGFIAERFVAAKDSLAAEARSILRALPGIPRCRGNEEERLLQALEHELVCVDRVKGFCDPEDILNDIDKEK